MATPSPSFSATAEAFRAWLAAARSRRLARFIPNCAEGLRLAPCPLPEPPHET